MIYLNGELITFGKFPNGETNIDGDMVYELVERYHNRITLKYTDDSDFIKLMFLKKHLDSLGVDVSLRILYMPYSRQDRVEGNSVFTLKHISDLINFLNFSYVSILEPHSDVTMALIDRSRAEYPTVNYLLTKAFSDIGFDRHKDYIFFPDAGSQKRYGKIKGFKQLVGFKERDFATGNIKNLQIVGDVETKGFKVVIIDDLCSRGGTFILSAEKLKAIGASEIYLVVTHCEATVFEGDILKTDLISKVFTTNSIINQGVYPKIKIYSQM